MIKTAASETTWRVKGHVATLASVIANTRKVYELLTQARGRAYFGLNRVLLAARGQRLSRPFHQRTAIRQGGHLIGCRQRTDVLQPRGQQVAHLKIAHTCDRLKGRLNRVVDLIARELRHALKGYCPLDHTYRRRRVVGHRHQTRHRTVCLTTGLRTRTRRLIEDHVTIGQLRAVNRQHQRIRRRTRLPRNIR